MAPGIVGKIVVLSLFNLFVAFTHKLVVLFETISISISFDDDTFSVDFRTMQLANSPSVN